jgi:PPE-repeat protein
MPLVPTNISVRFLGVAPALPAVYYAAADAAGTVRIVRTSAGVEVVPGGLSGEFRATINYDTAWGASIITWDDGGAGNAPTRSATQIIGAGPVSETVGVLPSYLTLTEAQQLANLPAVDPAWATATDAAKLAALQLATSRIDSLAWQGRRHVDGQTMAFPRVDGRMQTCVSGWESIDRSTLPAAPSAVRIACLIEASTLLDGQRQAAQIAMYQGKRVKRRKIGSAEVEYEPLIAPAGGVMLTAEAMQLLAPFRLRSGRMI